MAYQFNTAGNPNGVPFTTGVEFVYALKTLLKLVGWVVFQSGTGTSGSYALSDLITSAAVLDATRAWFEIRDPAGGRSFIFQRIANNGQFRIKYAAVGGFTSGTANENTTPGGTTVGEEKVLTGAGTDGTPTGSNFGGTAGSAMAYMAADDAAPYGFCAYGRAVGSASDRVMFGLDTLVSGSYDAADTDPAVVICAHSSSTSLPSLQTGITSASAWIRKASGSGAFTGVGYLGGTGWGTSSSPPVPKAAGSDPESGDEITGPVIWGRNPGLSAPAGWKGVSSLFRIQYSNRSNGDTLDAETRVVINSGEISMPWNGTTPLV